MTHMHYTRPGTFIILMVVVHLCVDAIPKRPSPYYPDMLKVPFETQGKSLVIIVVEGGDACGGQCMWRWAASHEVVSQRVEDKGNASKTGSQSGARAVS